MGRDLIALRSRLSQDACQLRVSSASQSPDKIIGYALSSQVDVIDGGYAFELRHKLEPAVFTGAISSSTSDTGSVITGQIQVPGQNWYRCLIGFVFVISIAVLASSAWDLAFGTRYLLTRSRHQLGPGHFATPEQHWLVLVLIPLVALPIVAALWPKARGVSKEARQTLSECLGELFCEIS